MSVRTWASVALGAAIAVAAGTLSAEDLTRYLERMVVGPGPDYKPNREKVIPHVSGDEKFSDTYRFWKDEEAIARARKEGRMSHEINYKDFRWAEKSMEGEAYVERGEELFHRRNAQSQSCAACHGDAGSKISDAQTRFPAYNERLGRVVSMPTQIGACATERLGTGWDEYTTENTLINMYIASLADGKPVNIDVSEGPMKESFERGRDLFFKRTGHFNFACASCHTPPTTGNYLRGQRPTTFFGDAVVYPVYHFPYALSGYDREYVFTLQHQIKSCQTLSRMYAGVEGSPPMTDIETFLQATSNGYPISVPTNFYNLDAGYLSD